MTSQFISLAAQFAELGGPAGLSALLVEPSMLPLVALASAGVLVGRFMIGRN